MTDQQIAEEKRTEELVEKLVQTAFDQIAPPITTLVGHRWPDDDVWLCFYIAKKYMPKASEANMVFVNHGERISEVDDPTVLYFDTGGGQFDQHAQELHNIPSAELLAKHLGVERDPGLQPLLEMVRKVDNVEPLEHHSLHFLIVGWPRLFQKDGNVDWEGVQGRVFEAFDIIYGQAVQAAKAREDLKRYGDFRRLPNGITLCVLVNRPSLRDAAFEQGSHVVVWTQKKKRGFYVGVQTKRNAPWLRLNNAVASLRQGEAKTRGVSIPSEERAKRINKIEAVPNWFLHPSEYLILSGSRKWKLKPEEYTRMEPNQIVERVQRALAAIPHPSVPKTT